MRCLAHGAARHLSLPRIGEIVAYRLKAPSLSGVLSVCLCSAGARCQRAIVEAVYQPEKALALWQGPFLTDTPIARHRSVERGQTRSCTGYGLD